jgi:drug/metabolite transporter (DMT)-like permease
MNRDVIHRPINQSTIYLLLLGAVLISFAPIWVRLSDVGPIATAFYRLLLSLPVLWVWMIYDKKNNKVHRQPSSLKDYASLIMAGFFFTGDISLWHWSITMTSIAKSTLLVNIAPVFVTIAAYLIFGERFSRKFLIGMACALFGIFVLLGESFTISRPQLFGDLLGIIAAIFYGGYILIVGRLRSVFSTITVMAWSGLVTTILLIPIILLSGESLVVLSINGWLILIGLALVSHVAGQGLIAYALAHLPSALGAVGLLLQPVLATSFAWVLFQESMGLVQIAGCLIVLNGIFLAKSGS